MPSTATTRLRLEKQALGENSATWGAPKLNDVIDRLDEAIGGVESISTSGGTTTLTSVNYSTDQARKAVLVFSGTLASNAVIVVPNVEKTYLCVNNTTGSFSLTVKTAAGTGYALRSGANWVYCDATNVSGAVPRLDQAPLPTSTVDLNSQRIVNLGTPSASTDAATKAYVDAAVSTTPTQNLATSDGTALAPTYSWASDSNTGIYRVGADSLGITAGGTVRATVSSTGLAVSGVFSVSGAMTASGGLGVTGAVTTSGATSIGTTLGVTGAATLGSTLAVTGAATLSSTLGVTGAATFGSTLGVTGAITATAGMTAAAPVLGPAGSAAAPSHSFSGDPDTGVYSGGTNILSLATAGSERVQVSAAGDVGVGATPLNNTNSKTLTLSGTLGGTLELCTTSGTLGPRIWGLSTDNSLNLSSHNAAGKIVFRTNTGTVRTTIDGDGYLLHGQSSTTLPGYLGNTTVGMSFWGSAGRVFVSQDNFSNWNMNSDGTLIAFNRSGSVVGGISVTTTTTAFNTSSDYRLKTNVEALTGAVTRLAALKPSRFRFASQAANAPKIDGFLAHEVTPAVPEAVTGAKDAATMQQLDLSKLVPLLVAAVQELAVRLTAAEAALPPGKTK
jgi:hypothetical protein